MRKEVENWWKQAERDMLSAENAFRSGDYYLVTFLYQQSVEKSLEALYIKKRKESPGRFCYNKIPWCCSWSSIRAL